MCGIVGLYLKDLSLERSLGSMLSRMLDTMCERGPDSAGFAIFGNVREGRLKLTLRMAPSVDPVAMCSTIEKAAGGPVVMALHDSHAVVSVPADRQTAVRQAIAALEPDVAFVGAGRRMEIFKEVGRPDAVAKRFELGRMTGTHGIGHTRMATESAVTTDGAHPFTTGLDQCLVHNGSLSNHNALRRQLRKDGLTFETENDSEVAAGYLSSKIRQGNTLRDALQSALHDLDGFYTFVIGTETGFAVLRDPIACKPAVMAETDDWVAFGTEYRALAELPGIDGARVWEPEPATIYIWERA